MRISKFKTNLNFKCRKYKIIFNFFLLDLIKALRIKGMSE